MIAPLSLKSQSSTIKEERKGNVITASELLVKFSMKSPTNDRSFFNGLPSNKSKQLLPKTRQIASRRQSAKNEGLSIQFHKEVKSLSSAGSPVFRKMSKQSEKKSMKSKKQTKKLKENSKISNQKQLFLEQLFQNKENNGFNDNLIEPLSTHRSHTLKSNITLTVKAPIPLTSKHTNEEQYFRKTSIASTLSYKTKHTASLQHSQDDSDLLFAHEPLVQSIYKKMDQNVFEELSKAKKKVYQLIYSLDKKLMVDMPIVKQKPIVINLRMKKEKTSSILQ